MNESEPLNSLESLAWRKKLLEREWIEDIEAAFRKMDERQYEILAVMVKAFLSSLFDLAAQPEKLQKKRPKPRELSSDDDDLTPFRTPAI